MATFSAGCPTSRAFRDVGLNRTCDVRLRFRPSDRSLTASRLGVRHAQGIGSNQILSLVTVNLFKIEQLLTSVPKGSRAEVINLPRLCREMRERHHLVGLRETRLPVRTRMMFTRLHRHGEIGIVLVGTHPCSVEPNLRCQAGPRQLTTPISWMKYTRAFPGSGASSLWVDSSRFTAKLVPLAPQAGAASMDGCS